MKYNFELPGISVNVTFEAVFFLAFDKQSTLLIEMKRYTLQQGIEMIKIHFKNYENLAETFHKT